MRRTFKSFSMVLLCFFICITTTIAQNNYSINGYIKDKASGEDLIGATLYFPELKLGTVTNTYGFYSITIPEGVYKARVTFIGFNTIEKEISLDKDFQLDIELSPITEELEEVVISGKKVGHENIRNTKTGVVTISPKDIRSVPVIFGEQDIIKTLQLESGVKSGTEGMSGMYVRGGSNDQNLILLDEAPVYNVSHAGGLFSVFNSDAIKDATLIKGNYPSNFGGRLSSVLDIHMKEGNNQKFHMEGGIGLISSRLTVESPIVKGKSSFMISGRRSYLDLMSKPFVDKDERNNGFYFYDLNAKVNTWIGKKDRIFLSGYFGRDIISIGDDFNINWGNKTGTVRWNHLFNNKLFSNVSLIFSKYDYQLTDGNKNSDLSLEGGIEDINLKTSFQYYMNPKIKFDFGADFIYHTFRPGRLVAESNSPIEQNRDLINALEGSLFASANIDLLPNWSIEAGLRYTNFAVLGPFQSKSRYEGQITTTKDYKDGEVVKLYQSPEPRLTTTYVLNENNSLKAAYSRNQQFYHILSTTSGSNPMDVWYPATEDIMPSTSNQYLLGFYHDFNKGKWNASVEGYYKDFYNVKELNSGSDIFKESIEPNILEGDGYAYGIEFSLKKTSGKLRGWANYTYSRVWHEFKELNNGKKFPGGQDRPHDISIVIMYQLSKSLELGALWTYQTGQVYTQPQRKYSYAGMEIPMYSDINGARFENYHRMDFNVTYTPKRTRNRRWKQFWTFSVYNLYGRSNPILLRYEDQGYGYSGKPVNQISGAKKIKAISFFKFVPSITYNFTF
ncbi:MAG: TonB-dependent receptor domain-containing protein [Bacteroidales bacterium]